MAKRKWRRQLISSWRARSILIHPHAAAQNTAPRDGPVPAFAPAWRRTIEADPFLGQSRHHGRDHRRGRGRSDNAPRIAGFADFRGKDAQHRQEHRPAILSLRGSLLIGNLEENGVRLWVENPPSVDPITVFAFCLS